MYTFVYYVNVTMYHEGPYLNIIHCCASIIEYRNYNSISNLDIQLSHN